MFIYLENQRERNFWNTQKSIAFPYISDMAQESRSYKRTGKHT